MPKHKVQSPQDLYWARKQAQEAYLPPGLINHGNTCFMNSVLQGLIATRLLSDIVQFHDIPEDAQAHSSTLLLSRRSPQLTNGHGLGGTFEKEWVDMPIGDRFIEIMYRAWHIQSQRKRENLSPKDLLAAIGKKYDQYLDFAQQDAHEFLRILLDAMRMEEQDVIKQRQPPPPKRPKKRRRSSQPIPSSSIDQQPSSILSPDVQPQHHRHHQHQHQHHHQSSPHPPRPEADTLISFSDMIFGGKLTSILVCQKCKHISQTYEDFNDISLSLKPEDYAVVHSRKRDRFKNFARKLAAFPSTSLVASATTAATATAQSSSNHASNSGGGAASSKHNEAEEEEEETRASRAPRTSAEPVHNGLGGGGGSGGRMGMALSIQRSSSVPPSPREREDPQISDKLPLHLISSRGRRSMEHLQSDLLAVPTSSSSVVVVVDDSTLRGDNGDNTVVHAGIDGDAVAATGTTGIVTGAQDGSDDPEHHKRMSSNDTKETESDGSNVIINGGTVPTLVISPEEKHVGFAAAPTDKPIREKKKRDGDDNWTKISRRLSLTVKLGRRDKEKEKDKDKTKDKEKNKEKDKDAEAVKLLKKQGRRFSGLPTSSSSKSKSPIATSSTASDVQSARLSHETSTRPPSPGRSSTPMLVSISSPGLLLPQHSTTTTNSTTTITTTQPQPPIAAPVPLRSFSSQSHNTPRLNTPLQSIQNHMQTLNTHVQAQVQKVSNIQRSRSPKAPKQGKEEQEYLRRILADVAPAMVPSTRSNSTQGKPSLNGGEKGKGGGGGGSDVEKSTANKPPLTRLTTSPHFGVSGSSNRLPSSQEDNSSSSTAGTAASVGTWLPIAAMSQFTGLEECLRMFTAVEVLDGENMVGCRRCWKIQNGYIKGNKDGEDSDEDEDEDKEVEVEREGTSTSPLPSPPPPPPLRSFDSQSSTNTTTTFASAMSGGEMSTNSRNGLNTNVSTMANAGHSPLPLSSASTPTLVLPASTTFTLEDMNDDYSITTPRLPHRSNSTPIVEQMDYHHQWSTSTIVSSTSLARSPPPVPMKDYTHNNKNGIPTSSPPSSPRSRSIRPPQTPGGLPIPRISTTPAAGSSSNLNGGSGVRSGGIRVKDILEHDNERDTRNDDDEASDNGTQTPVSGSSSRSSVLLPESNEELAGEDDMKKRRQGIIFRNSLVVPTRMPGRSNNNKLRTRTIRTTTTTTSSADGDGGVLSGSEVESVTSNGSFSRSASPSGESESDEESGEEEGSFTSDVDPEYVDRKEDDDGLLVPPGLGHEVPSLVPPSTLPSTTKTTKTTVPSQSAPSKSPTKPKKKKETILRPAFKRYLISIPPPVLVIHLKRFQQLNTHNSSAFSSFAEKLTAGFSSSNSGGRSSSYRGGGFGGFGGIGGGGFKKLEEFVSFPEWLDLSPFLSPKKEDIVSSKKAKSRSGGDGQKKREIGASSNHDEGKIDKDERCMYRLYAVVVHIGNMLGGHYIAYVALPEERPLSGPHAKEGDTGTPRPEKRNSEEGPEATEKHNSPGGQKLVKRQWAYISDTNVRLVSLEEVLNARAYICMYERV